MRIAWLLTLISAAAYALAFPPVSLAPLMWFALAPLFAACARVRPGQAALLAGSFAVLAAAGVAYWLPGMLTDFFGVPAGKVKCLKNSGFASSESLWHMTVWPLRNDVIRCSS